MYKSPIDIIYGQMETQLEGTIMRAVQNVHVNVDKGELLKALQYDRGQYEKGYADGKSKWIPVTERLPEPYTNVLSYAGYGTLYEVDGVDEKGNWVSSYISEYPVTHWMPLPEAPKGE